MFTTHYCDIGYKGNEMHRIIIWGVTSVLAVTACTSASVENRTATSFEVVASAAPICGLSNKEYADHAAAIEVIKRGGDKFVYADSKSVSNRVPSVSNGVITYNTYTKRTGIVQMVDDNHPDYDHALSARKVLGANWQEIVKKGPSRTCLQ